jgi:TM2 domain-containing membrane protein YozV
MRRSVYRRYRVLKKNPWILSLSLAAFLTAPALQAADTTAAAAPAKTAATTAAATPAKTDAKAAPDKAAASKDASPSTVGHKSPALAGTLAFIPGIVVHGAGHMYAGSWMKGLGLLAIEGLTVGVIANNVSTGTSDIQALSNSTKNNQIPTDVSSAYSKAGIIIVCGMGFLWSWFDDMAGAPIAATEYNKLLDQENNQAHLRLQPRVDGVELALSKNF